jgi:thiol-disulfide isomerase/thioredoxin
MLDRITIVLAQWCPHCVPVSLEKAEQMAKQLGVKLRVLDIDDPEQEKIADSLVKDYGDPADDYLIPQVFFEEDGNVKHVFTGFSEGLDVTSARWDDFFASEYYRTKLAPPKKPN